MEEVGVVKWVLTRGDDLGSQQRKKAFSSSDEGKGFWKMDIERYVSEPVVCFMFGVVKNGYCSAEYTHWDVSFKQWTNRTRKYSEDRFLFSVASVRDECIHHKLAGIRHRKMGTGLECKDGPSLPEFIEYHPKLNFLQWWLNMLSVSWCEGNAQLSVESCNQPCWKRPLAALWFALGSPEIRKASSSLRTSLSTTQNSFSLPILGRSRVARRGLDSTLTASPKYPDPPFSNVTSSSNRGNRAAIALPRPLSRSLMVLGGRLNSPRPALPNEAKSFLLASRSVPFSKGRGRYHLHVVKPVGASLGAGACARAVPARWARGAWPCLGGVLLAGPAGLALAVRRRRRLLRGVARGAVAACGLAGARLRGAPGGAGPLCRARVAGRAGLWWWGRGPGRLPVGATRPGAGPPAAWSPRGGPPAVRGLGACGGGPVAPGGCRRSGGRLARGCLWGARGWRSGPGGGRGLWAARPGPRACPVPAGAVRRGLPGAGGGCCSGVPRAVRAAPLRGRAGGRLGRLVRCGAVGRAPGGVARRARGSGLRGARRPGRPGRAWLGSRVGAWCAVRPAGPRTVSPAARRAGAVWGRGALAGAGGTGSARPPVAGLWGLPCAARRGSVRGARAVPPGPGGRALAVRSGRLASAGAGRARSAGSGRPRAARRVAWAKSPFGAASSGSSGSVSRLWSARAGLRVVGPGAAAGGRVCRGCFGVSGPCAPRVLAAGGRGPAGAAACALVPVGLGAGGCRGLSRAVRGCAWRAVPRGCHPGAARGGLARPGFGAPAAGRALGRLPGSSLRVVSGLAAAVPVPGGSGRRAVWAAGRPGRGGPPPVGGSGPAACRSGRRGPWGGALAAGPGLAVSPAWRFGPASGLPSSGGGWGVLRLAVRRGCPRAAVRRRPAASGRWSGPAPCRPRLRARRAAEAFFGRLCVASQGGCCGGVRAASGGWGGVVRSAPSRVSCGASWPRRALRPPAGVAGARSRPGPSRLFCRWRVAGLRGPGQGEPSAGAVRASGAAAVWRRGVRMDGGRGGRSGAGGRRGRWGAVSACRPFAAPGGPAAALASVRVVSRRCRGLAARRRLAGGRSARSARRRGVAARRALPPGGVRAGCVRPAAAALRGCCPGRVPRAAAASGRGPAAALDSPAFLSILNSCTNISDLPACQSNEDEELLINRPIFFAQGPGLDSCKRVKTRLPLSLCIVRETRILLLVAEQYLPRANIS
nr:hypothetical protein Iba_chr06aCG19750 [Ipomoea batatas]